MYAYHLYICMSVLVFVSSIAMTLVYRLCWHLSLSVSFAPLPHAERCLNSFRAEFSYVLVVFTFVEFFSSDISTCHTKNWFQISLNFNTNTIRFVLLMCRTKEKRKYTFPMISFCSEIFQWISPSIWLYFSYYLYTHLIRMYCSRFDLALYKNRIFSS